MCPLHLNLEGWMAHIHTRLHQVRWKFAMLKLKKKEEEEAAELKT